MTNTTETKFRGYLKRTLGPKAYIRKIPDFKQTGYKGSSGLPDYLVIANAITAWYEVKKSPTKTTFNLNLISESQWIEFTRMNFSGASIYIAAYVNNKLYIIPYKLLKMKQAEGIKSLSLTSLHPWIA